MAKYTYTGVYVYTCVCVCRVGRANIRVTTHRKLYDRDSLKIKLFNWYPAQNFTHTHTHTR